MITQFKNLVYILKLRESSRKLKIKAFSGLDFQVQHETFVGRIDESLILSSNMANGIAKLVYSKCIQKFVVNITKQKHVIGSIQESEFEIDLQTTNDYFKCKSK